MCVLALIFIMSDQQHPEYWIVVQKVGYTAIFTIWVFSKRVTIAVINGTIARAKQLHCRK